VVAALGAGIAQADEQLERFEHGGELNHKTAAGSPSFLTAADRHPVLVHITS
jgi:hypothetical protein